jgi:hypothetical protein
LPLQKIIKFVKLALDEHIVHLFINEDASKLLFLKTTQFYCPLSLVENKHNVTTKSIIKLLYNFILFIEQLKT